MPMVAFTETLDVMGASRAAFELFGVPCLGEPDKAVLANLTETILGQQDFITSLGAASMRLQAPGSREKFAWRSGRRTYEVSLSAASAPESGLMFLACFLDQTGQLELERAGAQARSFLESIMSSLHLGLTVVNRDLLVTNINSAQQQQLTLMGAADRGLSLIGLALHEVFPDEDEVFQALAPDVLEKSAVCGGIMERYEHQGVEHVFSVGFSPLRDDTGAVVGMIRVSEDVTDREKMAQDLHEAELRASEVETIHKLMVTLNHEINNSLTAVTGNIELLRATQPAFSEEQQTMLQEVATHTERIAVVTERLRNATQVKTVAYLSDGPDMIDTGLPEAGAPGE